MAAESAYMTQDEKLIWYDKLLLTLPGLTRKGKTNPYTSCNGHMFTHLTPEGLFSIRLPEADCQAFIKKYQSRFLEIYGIVKKDFVVVPDALLKKTKELSPYLQKSFVYVQSLKPKSASTRKK